MNISYSTSKDRHLPLLLVISACLGLIGVLCIVFQISPERITAQLGEFARHHYLLVGFCCLVIAVVLIHRIDNAVKAHQTKKEITHLKYIRTTKIKLLGARMKRLLLRLKRSSQYTSPKELLQTGIQPQEVLASTLDRSARLNDLKRALRQQQTNPSQIIIHYLDGGVKKHTIAFLWHVDEENVCLSSGAVLPIKNIYRII